MAQKRARFVRFEIADGRSWKETGMCQSLHLRGQYERESEVRFDRQHRDLRVIASKLLRFADEHFCGNVYRDISGYGRWRIQQDPRFLARTAPELDERAARGNEARDLTRMLAQDRHLATGQIVFRSGGDGFEQLRADLIVEVFRRNPFGLFHQSGNDLTREQGLRDRWRAAKRALITCGH